MLNGFKRAVVTMLMLSMVLGLFVFTASAEDILLGDVDANQSVTTADARAILRHAVKIENLAESSLLAADVNQDGNITSADARGALRVAVRLDDAVTITTPDEPTEPTLPEDPTEPDIPEEPTEPTLPEEPTVPEEPTEPEVPEEPTEPDIPEEPTRPGEPGDSAVVGQMAVESYRVPQGEDDCCYVMFITNNSNQLVQIEAQITAYDAQGNAVDSASGYVRALSPGQTSYVDAWFEDSELAQSFDYSLEVTEEDYYRSIEDVTYTYDLTADGVVIAATNNGDADAWFVRACAVFLKNGIPVDMDWSYITNSNSVIPAGETLTEELNCYADDGFDEVIFALDGRVDEQGDAPVAPSLTEQMDVTTYTCPSGENACYYVLFVTNNSDRTVQVGANVTSYDAQGNMVGSSSGRVYVVAPGQTAFIDAWFDNWESTQSFDYTLNVTQEEYFEPMEAVTFAYSQTPSGVVIAATNNSSRDAWGVEACAIFMKDGVPVYFGTNFVVNDKLELPAGETLAEEIDCHSDDGYDEVIIALNGRMDEQDDEPELSVTPEQLAVETYTCNMGESNGYHVMFITNNSDSLLRIGVNMIAFDAQGNMSGANSDTVDALAPGQTAFVRFWLDNPELIQRFDYAYNITEEDYYGSIEAVTFTYNQTPDGVSIAATNHGEEDAEFVQACVVFLKDGTPVDMDTIYITNDDSVIPAGETLTEEIRCYAEVGFDDVVIALRGHISD